MRKLASTIITVVALLTSTMALGSSTAIADESDAPVVVTVSATCQNAHGEVRDVPVRAAEGWQGATFVSEGSVVQICASGNATADDRNYRRVGPEGYEYATDQKIGYFDCKVSRGATFMTLLGSFNGRVFEIGRSYLLRTSRHGGVIRFRMNDDCLDDNAGVFHVKMVFIQ